MTNIDVHGPCGEAPKHTPPSIFGRTSKSYLKGTRKVNAGENEWHCVKTQTFNRDEAFAAEVTWGDIYCTKHISFRSVPVHT